MSRKATKKQPIERVTPDPLKGLDAPLIEERKRKGYANVAVDPNEKSTLKIIAGNFFTFFNIVLFSIALLFIGFIIYLEAIGRDDVVNAYFGFSKFVFLIPAVMNVCMGSYQEVKSLRVIKKLRIVTKTKSKVVRGGEILSLEGEEIVLDDVVALSAGDQATADLIVLTGEVFVDESMLTGESDHVKKAPGDRILSGSSVIVGEARCLADAVGNDTYAAGLTRKVKSGARRKSELMTSIMRIIKMITAALGIVLCVVVVTMIYKIASTGSDPSIWDGMTLKLNDPVTWSLIFLTGGTYGIGMIPTGLVLTASVALMVSIAQLTKKKTLIQELYSLENLSRVDVICLDKTGTLTDGTMNVVEVKAFIDEEEVNHHARALMAASGERNATAQAIYERFGIDENADIKEKIPFSSAVKYSGLIYGNGKKLLMGAPEYLLPAGDARLSFSSERAAEGKRVIALTLDGALIAFIVIEDHIRDSAPETLRFFRENGVAVKVISGDNPLTVSKIAEQCGIKFAERYISLAGVPLEEIPEIAGDYTVFARVSPEQKEALVRALQEQGHKVAMTGDGVNDILALRRADSSITFAKATDAAKSCSDVVLLDNDFSHLKEVVGEGRRVISNIQKTAVLYLMKTICVLIFAFALIPFAKGQMWLSIESMYMLEAAVIGTGGFLLSLEPIRRPIKGSFMKNILTQSLAAGVLAAFAILLPLLLNTLPAFFGAQSFITDGNVRTMMTVLTTIAGFVVIFSMCLPFTRYRAITMAALTGVALFLGLLLPASFIGGNTMGPEMLKFGEGQTIFDSRLVQEMFRPQNSAVVRDLFADKNNFIVLRVFLYVVVPVFILVRFAVENYTRKNYGKDVKKNRAFRIARRMMLASGFVLILHALLSAVETIWASGGQMVQIGENFAFLRGYSTLLNIVCVVINLIVGYIGYKLWKDPTKKMIRIAFAAAIVLLCVTVLNMILEGTVIAQTNDALLIADNVVLLIVTAAYILGALIVRIRIDLGLAKKRED